MRPVTVHTFISAPREEIFEYVADLANRVAFADHFLGELRLTSPKSSGTGAAARFALAAPAGREWGEIAIVDCAPPRRIVEEGRVGRLGRTRTGAVYELSQEVPGLTRVELTSWSEPGTRLDALKEMLGGRRWLRRQMKTALERLRIVFEEARDAPLARASIAGYEPGKAARFGA